MVQKHWPAYKSYKSQVAFEDLYWMQASLNRGLLFRLCARAAVHSVVEIGDRRQDHSPRGGGALAWPLMRNWDHQ